MELTIPVRRALLSVSNKAGLVEFATGLAELSVELLSTGGTARTLRAAGLAVTDVAAVTGFPEMLDGRVKTLHPCIHGGLLAVRGNAAHERQIAAQGIAPIDLVAVTLYPFEDALRSPDATPVEVNEQIDIGGPALIRSAAKNFEGVAAVVDPEDYAGILVELRARHGSLSRATRCRLAGKAFAHTARYDSLIAGFFERLSPDGAGADSGSHPSGLDSPQPFPPLLQLRFERLQGLRYGENPHQRAACYRDLDAPGGILAARQVQGKELSYNNILDLDAAWKLAQDFPEPVVAIVKHNNPCGVATNPRLCDAYERARAADPVSAFGGIIGLNRALDADTARAIAATFVEAVIAPGSTEEARTVLAQKKNLPLLDLPAGDWPPGTGEAAFEFRRVSGGLLVQDPDRVDLDPAAWRTVTRRSPTAPELAALQFGWRVVAHVKSNAIVLASPEATVGIGAGQMSRVDAVRLAVLKASAPTQGTVLASDAFFPFRDGVDLAADAGVTAIIQPGGSVRDAEVIAAADERGLAMIFTGRRHFRH